MVETCTSDQLDRVVELLDEEFILSKNRNLSFEKRFPSVYCKDNLDNIFVDCENDQIISIVSVKKFDLIHQETSVSCAMLGGVYTRAGYRGQGRMSKMLAYVDDRLMTDGVQIGVLYSRLHRFYEKSGWILADSGRLGRLLKTEWKFEETACDLRNVELVGENVVELEKFRRSMIEICVERSSWDYESIPIPSAETRCLCAFRDDQIEAYIVAGVGDECVYIFELIGNEEFFPSLLAGVRQGKTPFFINDHFGTRTYAWLSDKNIVEWKENQIAMWKIYDSNIAMDFISRINIGYFDVI